MYYVQYGSINADGEFVGACGDRAVVILDGRNSLETMHADAVKFNGYRRPWYEAYQIYAGESFTTSVPTTDWVFLPMQDDPRRLPDAYEKIKSALYEAAMQIDEYSQLSMDAQGEVINEVVSDFINLIMREVKTQK